MKWHEWAVLIAITCLLGIQIYTAFFQSAPEKVIIQGRDSIIERYQDCTVVLKEREKVIYKQHEIDSIKIYFIPDSLLLREAYNKSRELLGHTSLH